MLGSFPVGDEAVSAAPDDGWAPISTLPTTWGDASQGSNPWTVLT